MENKVLFHWCRWTFVSILGVMFNVLFCFGIYKNIQGLQNLGIVYYFFIAFINIFQTFGLILATKMAYENEYYEATEGLMNFYKLSVFASGLFLAPIYFIVLGYFAWAGHFVMSIFAATFFIKLLAYMLFITLVNKGIRNGDIELVSVKE